MPHPARGPRNTVPVVITALLTALAGLLAGCAGPAAAPPIPVGAAPGAESELLAQIYAAALRYYGSAAEVRTGPDPVAGLDSGEVTVAAGLTGRLLTRFDPGAAARGDEQVYRTMVSALPEGIGAGDYTPSAQDKPALATTVATAAGWGGRDLTAALRHCAGLTVGRVRGGSPVPQTVGTCRPAPAVEFPDRAALFAAVRGGRIVAAWTSTAAPQPGPTEGTAPADVVVLTDQTSLIRAENVVPLFRRNVLATRQALALNEVAGELDTGTLAAMRAQVGNGADPAAVAAIWLDAHPLGR